MNFYRYDNDNSYDNFKEEIDEYDDEETDEVIDDGFDLFCQFCKKIFNEIGELKTHVKTVHEVNIKDHKCHICSEIFGKKYHLTLHIKNVHGNGKRTYVGLCRLCGKNFKNLTMLKSHMERIHEGQKPFACNFCNKTFGQNEHLKLHVRNFLIFSLI